MFLVHRRVQFVIILLLGLLTAVWAPEAALGQITLQGTVTDAATGETLPSANIQIEGTYRGTITNAEGRYVLRIDSLPATVRVRYIGYEGARRRITTTSATEQDFALEPSVVQMEELIVTGEDPGMRIMRRVIEQKQQWRRQLDTWTADAYNRFTVRNDTGIVLITETQTQAFWDRQRGVEEVVQARRQTANLLEDNLPNAAALAVANLYDDNIEIAGHEMIGVTHPDALRHYRFTLDSTRAMDGQRVFDIRVEPQSQLKTGFEGHVAVLDSAYALLEAKLKPSKAFLFPPPIKAYELHFEQQFSNFDGPFWLPVDFRATHTFDIAFSGLLRFPTVRVDQVSRLTNYETNVALPDSLYLDERRVRVDSASVARVMPAPMKVGGSGDSLVAREAVVPLSAAEERAYQQIDTTDTVAQSFKPSGLLARFVKWNASDSDDEGEPREVASAAQEVGGIRIDTGFRPRLWYNRVEGLHMEGALNVVIGNRLEGTGSLGYNTAAADPVQWTYGGRAALELGGQRRTEVFGSYRYGVDRRYESAIYGRIPTSLWALAGAADYFDYLGNERWRVGIEHLFRPIESRIRLRYNEERHFSVASRTACDVLGRGQQRANPPLSKEGRLRSLSARIEIGDTDRTFGLIGRRHLILQVEHSNDAWLASDYDFTRLHAELTWHAETFFQRRLLPNALDIRAVGGTFAGTLPLQQVGIVDASLEPVGVFGTLRTRSGPPYQGEQYVGVFWEHSFRTVPFELLGLDRAARRGYNLIVHGGHARTWLGRSDLPVAEGAHHELGVSFSGLFDLLRVDFTKRLDAPGLTIRVGVARLF